MTPAKNLPVKRATGKRAGKHTNRGVYEAAAILNAEGYMVGRVMDHGSLFDLMARKGSATMLLRVVRPKEPVNGARQVTEQYENSVRWMQKYYRSEEDNLQFWVFSREKGLLRYRVYDWGIGNEQTMKKLRKNTGES